MIKDNLVYVVKDSLYLSQKQLKERYQDWLVGEKTFINMWLRDRTKKTFDNMDFLPNQICEKTYNLWKGFEIENVPSSTGVDISIFHTLVNTLTDNNSDYFIKWLAKHFFKTHKINPKLHQFLDLNRGVVRMHFLDS